MFAIKLLQVLRVILIKSDLLIGDYFTDIIVYKIFNNFIYVIVPNIHISFIRVIF